MAIYFPPPPRFIGGAQPYAPRELTPPSNPPAADDPAFGQASRLEREFWSLRLSWEQPPSRPQGWRWLVHAEVIADNPPFTDREPLWAVFKAWQAPPLWVFDQSVLVAEPDPPPISSREPLSALLSWQIGARRIPGQKFVVQPAAAAAADAPPFDSRHPLSALLSWAVIPQPSQRQRVITQPGAALTVDDPPFSARTFWSSLLAWQIPRPRHEALPPLVQEFLQAVDNPPFAHNLLQPTLELWQMPWQPVQARRFAIEAAVVDEFPARRAQAPTALLAWRLEVPHIQQPAAIVQQFIAVVNDPPFAQRRVQPPYPPAPFWDYPLIGAAVFWELPPPPLPGDVRLSFSMNREQRVFVALRDVLVFKSKRE